ASDGERKRRHLGLGEVTSQLGEDGVGHPAHSASVAGHRFGESERRTVLVREQPALTESPQGLELLEREERFAPQMPTVLDAPPTLRQLGGELLHEEAE